MSSASARPGRCTPSRALSSSRPFLLVNPASGDESPTAGDVAEAARALGVEARVLRPGEDAGALAREAAEAGAPALGMAGGDGSLGSVAAIALERDLPLVCVPFGTRNHFARDLGFDPDEPLAALEAFAGVERRVDVGVVNDRIFLNNVSLGLYASFVTDPRQKTRNRAVAFLRMVPAALGKGRRPLRVTLDLEETREHRSALVVLVANNDYTLTSMADLGRRTRLDEGLLHVYVVEAVGRRALVRLLALVAAGRPAGAEGWSQWQARSFTVERLRPRIHAAVDGDPVVLASPLRFEVRPRALRVLVPRTEDRSGRAPADD